MMIAWISQWSHAIAAILFGALAFWQLRRAPADVSGRMLTLAAIATAGWALVVSINGLNSPASILAEHARNLGWLGFMYALWRRGGAQAAHSTVTVAAVYGVLVMVIVGEIGIDMLPRFDVVSARLAQIVFLSSMVLRMIVAVGALVLVHNLYTAATQAARNAIRLPMIALAAMWTYDLNLYTVSYLARGWSGELFALRGVALSIIAPIFGLAALRTRDWTVRLSRTVTFQSLSLVAIGVYLMVMVVVTTIVDMIGGIYADAIKVGFVFVASVAALMLLPSSAFRAWFRVKVSKHLFQHRYDYRAEWTRFTNTLGRPGAEAAPLDARVVQAIADITESPGGVLLVPESGGALVLHARWNWPSADPPAVAASADIARYLHQTGRVIELDDVRATAQNYDVRTTAQAEDSNAKISDHEDTRFIPEWILTDPRAWAIVPLVHFDRLAGVVLLERPAISRTLDWEDFDLLRVVGRQVASYLAEARGQEALSEAKRFDEFNRRFAFIMHDIKNLVSQLSLVTRNAERHADNPEFRADMIATLKNSTARMNDLLARLSQHNKARAEDPEIIHAGAIVERVAATKRLQHPVVIGGDPALLLIADPARLEQAIGHLAQNAIDASAPSDPVSLNIRKRGNEGVIEIVDSGVGMSAAFIRDKLFTPFSSTKDGGFGIGAFEARTIIAAMGGRIEVASREGEGSQFSIFLPLAIPVLAPLVRAEAIAA